jgi:UDP-glucose 4-epimerase
VDVRGKTLALVGGAGLIGSHTAEHLLSQDIGALVIYDNFSRGRHENLKAALRDPRVRVYEAGGDILHTDTLEAALRGVDGVFHFAALWLLHCAEFPRSAFDVNIRGTFNVIEASMRAGVRRLVFSSSASVYGDAEQERIDEAHAYRNRNFYGATKIAGEAMLRAFHHRGGLDYVGLRYMNVYGPRQDQRGAYVSVIMRMLDALDAGRRPVVVGSGDESYDFVAVEDCARANVCAMQAESCDTFYNVGTGVKTTLRELAEMLIELSGAATGIDYVRRDDASIVTSRVCDPGKALRELGFCAEVRLRDGLERLIEWRRNTRTSGEV